MKRQICLYGDAVLRKKAQSVAEISSEIRQLATDMIETMIASNGVGLAAPQVGVSLRIFVIRDEITDAAGEIVLGEPEVMINPVLSAPSKQSVWMSEGCLSIPGFHTDIERPDAIRICYQNLKGERIEEELTGFRARVAMHENDHLNGTLIIDRMEDEERKRIDPLLRSLKARAKSA